MYALKIGMTHQHTTHTCDFYPGLIKINQRNSKFHANVQFVVALVRHSKHKSLCEDLLTIQIFLLGKKNKNKKMQKNKLV